MDGWSIPMRRIDGQRQATEEVPSYGEIAVLCRVVPVVQHGEQIPLA
jgi:hypothetical protein